MSYQLFRRSWRADETEETWTLRVEQGSAMLHGPHGEQVVLSHHEDPHSILEEIQSRAPDALEVRSAHTTQITLSGELREWLPLYLHATASSPSAEGPNDWGGDDDEWNRIDEYDNDMSDLGIGAATDLMVFVGGQPWAVVDGAEARMVIPTDGGEGGLQETWANWLWIEQGSMTSGWDFAWIGTLTDAVGASHDRIDEVGSQWRVFPREDPIREIVEWLTGGWLIGQLRDTWTIESGSDPLIRGFIDMLAKSSDDIEFFGSDYAKGEGIGLTDTAHWQAQCALGSGQRRALLRALQALPETQRHHLSRQ